MLVRVVAPQSQTKWLAYSSCLFLFPCIYTVLYRLWFYASVLWLTSFISWMYWIYPVYGVRRNLDLVFAKVAFCVFFGSGVVYVRSLPCMLVGYSGTCILGFCFYMSHSCFQRRLESWWKYHVIFHWLLMCEQFLVLYCYLDHKKLM